MRRTLSSFARLSLVLIALAAASLQIGCGKGADAGDNIAADACLNEIVDRMATYASTHDNQLPMRGIHVLGAKAAENKFFLDDLGGYAAPEDLHEYTFHYDSAMSGDRAAVSISKTEDGRRRCLQVRVADGAVVRLPISTADACRPPAE